MTFESLLHRLALRTTSLPLIALSLGLGLLGAACTASSGRTAQPVAGASPAMAAPTPKTPEAAAMPVLPTEPPSPDPRVGLAAGRMDAAEAVWNMRVVSKTPPSEQFLGSTSTDLAFTGKYAIQGNYNGFQVWDISNPSKPTLAKAYPCRASQSDVSVYKNLLFVSGEAQTGRLDCGMQGVPEPVSKERLRGIRIFDVTDMANPKYVANVQTCRGSHTHTVVTDPNDKANVYIYVSGSAGVRSAEELPGCMDGPVDDPNSARFRIEVIRVPLAAPQQAAIVSSPRIFNGLAAPPRHADPPGTGRGGRGATAPDAAAAGAAGATGAAGAPPAAAANATQATGRGGRGQGPRTGPNQCHDITVYPAIGLAGGACGGYGFLLDIRDVANPKRLEAAADENMAFWHSATFNNDGSKILFSDEWGGGTQPRCRDTDKPEWGADALFTLVNNKLTFKSYYKIPAPQTAFENCVAHNGSLVPIPGRDVMVQAWYQGGISVFDWTDASKAKEIAYFDRGPMDATKLVTAGSWSAYYYNGYVVSSEIARGLDILELTPSGWLSQNELDAAKTVHFDYLNSQEQPKIVWPPSFPLVRAYLDQLTRSSGLESKRISAVRTELARAEKLGRQQRQTALQQLATQLTQDASGAADRAKVQTLAAAVKDLASAQR
jgi:hypothetical protein